jgi:ribosomal protein L40E
LGRVGGEVGNLSGLSAARCGADAGTAVPDGGPRGKLHGVRCGEVLPAEVLAAAWCRESMAAASLAVWLRRCGYGELRAKALLRCLSLPAMMAS